MSRPPDALLGPAICQGCGSRVYWTGRVWVYPSGATIHMCGKPLPVRTHICVCGVAISAFDDERAIAAAMRQHIGSRPHIAWREAS